MYMEIIFWLCVAWVLYAYVGYPVFVAVLARLIRRDVAKADWRPTVTVVTAARNEAKHIEATVRNKLEQDYPAEKLDVVVVSDESDDGTDDIVRAIASNRVQLIRQEPRAGKTAALNRVVPAARGEIVVFADANSMYEPGAIAALVRNFADPGVGYVTGRMLFMAENGSLSGDGSTAYMSYENRLRAAETRLGSIVGADGGVDAIRRTLYAPMRPEQQPDFVLPLAVVASGYRAVYEPDAVLREPALGSGSDEYRMRVRVTLRALWALLSMRRLFNPLRYGIYAWQLASHKLARYLVFVPLIIAAVCTVALWNAGIIYRLAAAAQVLLYGLGIAAAYRPELARVRVIALAGYFVTLNTACAHAVWRFIRGQNQALWTPRVG